MNGEEKILAILEQLQQGQARLEQGYAKLEQGQAATNARLDKLGQGQSTIEQGQAQLEQRYAKLEQEVAGLKDTVQSVHNSQIKVEQEYLPKINAALEGHMLNSEKLDDVLKNLEEITPTVQALEILYQTGYAK